MSAHAVSERIATGLHKLVAEGHRVIWWADPQAGFREAVADLSLDGADCACG